MKPRHPADPPPAPAIRPEAPPPADRAPPGVGARKPRRRGTKRRACLWLLLAATLAGGGTLAWLRWLGMPQWITSRALGLLADHGHHVDVSSIHFGLGSGIQATGVRYYDSPLRVTPVLDAAEVNVRLRWADWRQGRPGIRSVEVSGATVRWSEGTLLHRADPEQVVTLRDVSGWAEVHVREILISDLRARVMGVEVTGEGCIVRPLRLRQLARGRAPGEEASPPPEAKEAALAHRLVEEFQRMSFAEPPRLQVRFVFLPAEPARSTLRIEGAGGRTAVRGVTFDHWSIQAAYEDQTIRVTQCQAAIGGRRMEAAGRVDLGQDLVEARLDSSMAPAHWLSLMPAGWRERFSAMQVYVQGSAELKLDIGPSPLSAPWQALRGTVRAEGIDAGGVWIERVACRLIADGPRWRLQDIDAEIGNPSQRGRVRGECTVQFPERSFRGWCDARLDFGALLPWLDPGQVALVRRFQFGERKPRVAVEFAGRPGVREALFYRGQLEASDFSYRGAYCAAATASILHSNRVTRLDPIQLERNDGAVDGSLRIDFRERALAYEIESTVAPKALARASSDTLQRILRDVTFEGPTTVESTGRIRWGQRGASSAEARVEAEQLSVRSFLADRARFDVAWEGDRVEVRNIDAQVYGGRLTGRCEVFAEPGGKRPRYRMDATAEGVGFQDVVRTLFHKEGEPYRGRVDGDLALTGLVGEGQIPLTQGEGRILIRDGRITQIPVFGGLSHILSRIFPGLGFTTQTEFQCRFAVNGWALSLADIKIQGNVFSLTGNGLYDVQSQALDFDVEFRLLREGVVGSVVQWVTRPLTNLVKFDLEGTWDEPRWRPKNLPRELFEGFD